MDRVMLKNKLEIMKNEMVLYLLEEGSYLAIIKFMDDMKLREYEFQEIKKLMNK